MRRARPPVGHGAGDDASGRPARAARPRAAGDVQLAWAKDREGRKVHAARLGPLDRRARAPFSCLGCDEPLVPHLGRVRAPHFAHLPGSTCPLTAPETALHLDAKERLLALCEDAFAGRRRVRVLARCPGCRRAAPLDLAAAGDHAVAEGAVGALRADVLVLSHGRPALALEVRVTHAVEAGKEAALAGAGVPAAEVDAREEWEREDEDGVVIAPARSLGFPPCAACAVRARAAADRDRGGEASQIAELEAYRARGLLGRAPAGLPASAGKADPEAPLTDAERSDLARRFSCPACGGTSLIMGPSPRIARHACPAAGGPSDPRPVAWRGYDGSLVELSWWRRADRRG